MPELIRHGVTGFLCGSTDEMVDAVGRVGEIDRRACRADCERRFSPDRMVDDFEDTARELLATPRHDASTELAYAVRLSGGKTLTELVT